MNSLVFNTVASQLRSSVYGLNQTSNDLQLLQLNTAGELIVDGDLTITNTLLTVAGDVTISNPLLTVAGDVTISNTLLTVLIEGNRFTSNTQTLNGVSGTGVALEATDISQVRTATMFVDNTGSSPITVTLQLSPDGNTYFNNPNYTNIAIAQTSYTIIVVDLFAHFAQLAYDAGTAATFITYYNGQA